MADLTEEQIKLVNIVEKFFRQADNEAVPLMYSTMDIFHRLQSVYPSEEYTPLDVYAVMDYLKYKFLNSATGNRISWMLAER